MNNTERTPYITAGLYPAVISRVIDLGTQYSEYFGNYSPKLWIEFTIDDNGTYKTLGKEYTNSAYERGNLAMRLSPALRKPFIIANTVIDYNALIGQTLDVSVVVKNGYSDIEGTYLAKSIYEIPVKSSGVFTSQQILAEKDAPKAAIRKIVSSEEYKNGKIKLQHDSSKAPYIGNEETPF